MGGVNGILYAAGAAPSAIDVRPLPQILSRLQKGLLSPLTGKDVDDFASVDAADVKPRPIVTPPPTPPEPPQQQPPILKKEAAVVPTPPPTPPQQEKQEVTPPPPKVSTPPTLQIPKPPKISIPEIKPPQPSAAEDKKQVKISDELSDPVTEAFSSFFSSPSKPAAAPASPASTNEPSAAEKAKLARKKEAEEKRKAALAAAEERRREAEEKRAKALVAAEEKRRLAEEKKDALKKAEKVLNQAKPRATISLGFFGFGQKPDAKEEEGGKGGAEADDKPTGAPRGVPTLKNWRQKSNGSITGLIYGSRLFGAGESITTSPIKGSASENTVVTTKTGSK